MVISKLLQHAGNGLHGVVQVPGDKSISHRAVMLGSVANGETVVENYLPSSDVLTTIAAMRAMGVHMTQTDTNLRIQGRGWQGLQDPVAPLDFGNSGTTTRLMLGLLAKQKFALRMIGDASLSRRPMRRVTEPLKQMGAKLQTTDGHLPLQLAPTTVLAGIDYTLPVASAQVKSALILAGLQAIGETHIVEPVPTRDHTERMLAAFGVSLARSSDEIMVMPNEQLTGTRVSVPGDMSSAAFWLVAGLIVPNSRVVLTGVGMNPTRTGLLRLLTRMGAHIAVTNQVDASEPYADLTIVTQRLHGITVSAEDIPSAIDELPILVLAATQAVGDTLITGAEELRVKESDRIASVTATLNALGADIEARADGFLVHGGTPLSTTTPLTLSADGDHRLGMLIAIAALVTQGTVMLDDTAAIQVSYPTFWADLTRLLGGA
jgi:3-phosphoshikimate 1-carboxyvinyltransferase